MKRFEIVDRLIRSVSSSQNGLDNKYDPLYIESLIPSLYGEAIILDYNGSKERAASKRISGDCIFSTTLAINPAIQDSTAEYLLFELPSPPVRVNSRVNGLIYCGQKQQAIAFSEMYNRMDISIAKKRGFFSDGNDIAFIIKGVYIEVWGNKDLQEIDIDIVPQDVSKFPTWDETTDKYPVTEDLVKLMEILFQASQGINLRIQPDNVLNKVQ